ncbi:hypothetical protein HY798_01365 [Candidatus Falkowbacteria bacterium]|nr:hypothetical protein [Candidatus Falkowbacteria bacterium]
MEKVIYKDLSYKVTGLLFKTHKELGRYRNEKQYADYFEKLLLKEEINYKREYQFQDYQYGNGDINC